MGIDPKYTKDCHVESQNRMRVNHRAKNGMQSHDPTLHVTTDDKPTVGANSRSYCKVILQY